MCVEERTVCTLWKELSARCGNFSMHKSPLFQIYACHDPHRQNLYFNSSEVLK